VYHLSLSLQCSKHFDGSTSLTPFLDISGRLNLQIHVFHPFRFILGFGTGQLGTHYYDDPESIVDTGEAEQEGKLQSRLLVHAESAGYPAMTSAHVGVKKQDVVVCLERS